MTEPTQSKRFVQGAVVRGSTQHPGTTTDQRLLESRGLEYTTWEGWDLLDAHEISLGAPHDRARIKVVDRQTMVEVSRAVAKAHAEGDVQAEEQAYERFDEAVDAAQA